MPNSNVDLRDSDTSFGTEGRRNRSYNVDFLLFVDFLAYKFRGVWDPDMMDTESFFSSHTVQGKGPEAARIQYSYPTF